MKWRKRGEEVNVIYENAMEKVRKKKKAIIYGYAKEGKEFAEMLSLIGNVEIKAFVDRRYKDIPKDRRGIPVVSPEDIEKYMAEDTVIYVAVQYYTVDDVRIALNKKGYVEWEDFFVIHKLKILKDAVENDFLTVPLIEIPITERCTLNCRKCSFFTSHYKNPRDFELNEIKSWIDEMFKTIDYVETLRFLGGEPFLYPQFLEVLEYVKDRYLYRIGRLVILTNATIAPSKEIIEMLKQYRRVRIGITDYTHVVPYENKLKEFIKLLEENGLDYWCSSDKVWFDLKFPEELIEVNNPEVVFDECSHHCRTLYDNKLFWCSFNSSAYRAKLIEGKEGRDFITVSGASKAEIIEFIWGYSEVGYNELCKWCKRGEKNLIDSGEQSKRK